jgi:glycosyltransferase involved in cell wall biosynthesis
MRIGIDARFLTHPQKGGFKTYTENLVTALACVDDRNQYILYLDREPEQSTRIPQQPNFAYKVLKQLPGIGMPWREQVGISLQTSRDRIDLLHSPCLTAPLTHACPLVMTIHDTIWLFPQKYSQSDIFSLHWKLMQWYQITIPRIASRHASAILTVSQLSKDDIVRHLGIDPAFIHVTHGAVSSTFQPVDDPGRAGSLRTKYGLNTKYIFGIGSADPRKNIETLVNSYALLPESLRAEYHLAIMWTAPVLAEAISKRIDDLGIGRFVHFLYQVPNEDLVFLYNEASLFVFPSLYEGFGLPVLEAMACGTPVVAANTSSIPEVAGDAALLVEARDAKGIAGAMERVLSDERLASGMVQKGLKRNSMFSWEKCARETIMVYNQTLLSKQAIK